MTFVLAFLVGRLGVLALHTLDGVGGASRDGIFDQGIYGVLMGGAALTRDRARRARAARSGRRG